MADEEDQTQAESLDETTANDQDTESQPQSSQIGQVEPPKSQSSTKSTPSSPQLSESEGRTQAITDVCADFLASIYKSPYYRKVVKSVLVFALALKMAQESKMMVIPLKEYEPFTKH